jgi:hypothetical protein
MAYHSAGKPSLGSDGVTTPQSNEEPCRLAAIVFDRDEDTYAPLNQFLQRLAERGVRIAGLVQEREDCEGCEHKDLWVRNLTTGERFAIMQDLGANSEGCRVDPSAIAVAARQLGEAVRTRPDLIVANRFGRLESEGEGMIDEIGESVVEGVALIIAVPLRYLDAWNAFAGGLDRQLPPRLEAMEAWWESVAASAA